MASPSRAALSASSLKTVERSLVLLVTQLQEWLQKEHNLASFTMSESWLKASAWLGLSKVNQMGASHLSELDGPSCVALGVVSSIDMLPHGSGEGCHLFGCGDHLGIGLGEVAADGCSQKSDSPSGVVEHDAGWFDRQKESCDDFNFPLL